MVRLILLRIFESYFRHRWLNIMPIVLMIGVGSAYVVYSMPQYAARGTIYVQKQPLVSALSNVQTDFTWQTPAQVTASQLQDLMQTQAFVRSIIAKTPLEQQLTGDPTVLDRTISVYQKAVTVNTVGDNLIEVDGKYEDPATVQQMVAATMDMFVQWKLNTETQDSIVAEKFFNETIQPYQADVDKARSAMRTYLEAHPVPVRGERPPEETLEISGLQDAIDQATTRLNDAVTKAEDARLARSRAESNIRQMYLTIDAPAQPVAPTTGLRDKATKLGIFLAVGVVLSLLCIAGGALLDHSFRFALDVQHALHLPVLAMVPMTRAERMLLRAVHAEAAAAQAPSEPSESANEQAATEVLPDDNRVSENETMEQRQDWEANQSTVEDEHAALAAV
ncbi:MAG TPA: lipopolysaccharide biosynthesis protein [Roseiflexaceae bacterium]|nr:lipopolysaccharide biosynthesis protein [Roseiflexaceae bacterium]